MARVLLLTPLWPARGGNGLAMRAGVALEGLARAHEVTLAVVPVAGTDEGARAWASGVASATVTAATSSDARSWAATAVGRAMAAAAPLPAAARSVPPAVGDELLAKVGDRFDAVVVHRSYLAGAAVPFLAAGVHGVLDADDDDVEGECAAFTAEVRRHFATVLLAAPDDVAVARARDATVHHEVWPNAVHVPQKVTARAPDGDAPRLLFVGNRTYAPNVDAIDRLTRRIVPTVRDAGIDATLRVSNLDDDVATLYRTHDLACAPLRHAKGTSIKVLEAFAHGCPVVATPSAARGLAVTNGVELSITGDDEDDDGFAAAIVALWRDPDRRDAQAGAARAFVAHAHDAVPVGDALARIVDRVAAARPSHHDDR